MVTDAQPTHPNADRLVAFRLGRVTGEEGDAIQAHLADCEACRKLAEALQPDTLLALLQASATVPPVPALDALAPEAATIAPSTSALARSAAPPELAEHPRYRLLELLGAGGMGSVYKAEHRLMERPVALKVINRSLMEDPAAVERFRREVKTAARLSHPNIVTAFDAEQANEHHFLVMEYVDGLSLDRLIDKQGPLPVREACDFIRQAALGLQHAHERGMVHRDIKPQNLMRTPDGQIKVLDFGLARFVSESQPAGPLTQVGTVMGTPDYIAPEQAHDARNADIRADIYSLGCTFYYLLSGQAPFPNGSTLQKLMAHVEQTPRPMTEMRFDLPAGLSAVLARMMAKDPTQRYHTPAEVAQALAPFAEGKVTYLEYVAEAVPVAPEPPTTVQPIVPLSERQLQPRPRDGAVRSLSILSIVAGALALSPIGCLCFGLGKIPLSLLGLVLGGAAWSMDPFRHERKPILAVIGMIVCGVALAAAILR